MQAWTPLLNVPRGGAKYRVASRPGLSHSRGIANRSGLAAAATSPSGSAREGTPRTKTLPSASSISSGRASSSVAATMRVFSRTASAASDTAVPATTAARLAKVPVPHPNAAVSPVRTVTSRGVTPR